MKRIIILIALTVCQLAVMAQKGLHIEPLFEGKIVPLERMVETRVRGRSLNKYGLAYFRSLRFEPTKKEREAVVGLMEQDMEGIPESHYQRNRRKWSETIYVQLPQQGSNQRMLCYKYEEEEILVIYLEGPKASLETLKKMSN